MEKILGYGQIPDRIISVGTSFDSSNSGLFKGAYDWDFNLITPADSFYLQTPYTPDFNLSSGDISLEAYFNANSFTTGPGGWGMCILAKDTYGSNFDWSIFINSNSQIQFLTNATSNTMTANVPTMNVGQWYHVKFERVAGVNRIYLDGVSYGGTTTFGISDSSQFYITIGCSSWNNPGLHFDGYLDKIRIIKGGVDSLYLDFETINSDKISFTDNTGKLLEILPDPIIEMSLRNNDSNIITSFTAVSNDIVLHFDPINTASYDRIGTTLNDLSANGHTGILTNGASFNATDGSIDLDGVDNYILVNNTGLITPPELTIELWVNPTDLTATAHQNVWRNDVSGTPLQLIAFQNNATILSFGLTTSITGYAELDCPINYVNYDNNWMHIVATYTDGTKCLYVNGVKIGEATVQNVGSPYGTVWNSGGWADLSDYTTRVYGDWATTLGYNPPSGVGQEYIMHDYINNKYYKFMLTQWSSGASGGGFAYTRQEILSPSTFGPLVSFTKPNYATSTVDAIDTGLTIKRNNSQGLYNVAGEGAYQYSGYYYGDGSAGIATYDATNDLSIGSWIANTGESFKGKLGITRLYQIALTAEEVLNNYKTNKNNYQ